MSGIPMQAVPPVHFQPYMEGPASSYDLLAIAPFLVAALVIAALRRMNRKSRSDEE